MRLEGSCHCRAVRFELGSRTPQPYMRCFCSICRKTAGGGGYAINIMGLAKTLKVEGGKNLAIYRATMPDGSTSDCERNFCARCGSALWLFSPRWPELIYPLASAIDTPLPVPPEHVNLMVDYGPAWAQIPNGPGETNFAEYPEESIEGWHEKRGLIVD